jgi:hypothetical protein
MKRNLIKMIEDKKYNVVRVSRTEFELDNGDVYPHSFELDDDITVEVQYKNVKIAPECYWSRPTNWKEPHLLDIFQESIKQNTHKPNIKELETNLNYDYSKDIPYQ